MERELFADFHDEGLEFPAKLVDKFGRVCVALSGVIKQHLQAFDVRLARESFPGRRHMAMDKLVQHRAK